MYSVYVIRSVSRGRIYMGHSCDIERRLKEHRAGRSKATSYARDWELLFVEVFETRSNAVLFEKKLKAMKNVDRIVSYLEKSKSRGRAVAAR